MGKQGRIVVPAEIRSELGFDEGVRLVARVIDGELRILTYRANLERIRQRVRDRNPDGTNMVEELIADRRAEAAREEAKDARS
ncbi:MAG: AbrB family transcriptional regulator [Thermoleophilia bacterium]|nr:AbrB family transcriptional regulator [Thermoleophilia bacterium]